MHAINTRTLVIAIQAVDALITRTDAEWRAATGSDVAELEELLLAYSLAASDLKDQFDEAKKTIDNLPPYGSLATNS